MSVGLYLREAREASGYSIEQISAQTRIRAEVIRDLESDKFSSAGGNAYARGHMRTIGQFIGADIDSLMLKFEETTASDDRAMIDLLTENNATVAKPQRSLPKISYKFMASSAAAVVGLMILVPTASSILKSSVKPTTKVSAVKKSVTAPATQGTSTDSRKQQSSLATGSSVGNLVISADSGTTWIAVSDANGTPIFTGKIAKGKSQSFDASSLLKVTLGNSGAVSISLNGKNLGTPGAIGEVKYLQYGPGAAPSDSIQTQG